MKAELVWHSLSIWNKQTNTNEMTKYMTVYTVFQTSSARALKFHEASWNLLYKQ